MISKAEALILANKMFKGKALLGDTDSVLTVMQKEGFGGKVVGRASSWEDALVDAAINADGMGMNGTFEDVQSRLEDR